jgi:hypothetical protein
MHARKRELRALESCKREKNKEKSISMEKKEKNIYMNERKKNE